MLFKWFWVNHVSKNISSGVELIGLGFVVAKSNMVGNYIQCDNEKTSIDPTFDSQKSIVGVVSILDEIYSFLWWINCTCIYSNLYSSFVVFQSLVHFFVTFQIWLIYLLHFKVWSISLLHFKVWSISLFLCYILKSGPFFYTTKSDPFLFQFPCFMQYHVLNHVINRPNCISHNKMLLKTVHSFLQSYWCICVMKNPSVFTLTYMSRCNSMLYIFVINSLHHIIRWYPAKRALPAMLMHGR